MQSFAAQPMEIDMREEQTTIEAPPAKRVGRSLVAREDENHRG